MRSSPSRPANSRSGATRPSATQLCRVEAANAGISVAKLLGLLTEYCRSPRRVSGRSPGRAFTSVAGSQSARLNAGGSLRGAMFGPVHKGGKLLDQRLSAKSVCDLVKTYSTPTMSASIARLRCPRSGFLTRASGQHRMRKARSPPRHPHTRSRRKIERGVTIRGHRHAFTRSRQEITVRRSPTPPGAQQWTSCAVSLCDCPQSQPR
jgi:hypothetical protein